MELVLPADDPNATARFFVDELGFAIAAVRHSEDPREIVVVGRGLRVALVRGAAGEPGTLRAEGAIARTLRAPNGTRIEIAPRAPMAMPELAPALDVARMRSAVWQEGRAGMRYRDLIASRQGGRHLASHIRVETDGPVPDCVHLHRVRFQMIYVRRGEVRVVYEDQGPPFTMREGDCVLQPPTIRHRVLDARGLEVVEVSCPADHDTLADAAMSLPNEALDPTRRFDGQRFVFHRAEEAGPTREGDVLVRDAGIGEATGGLAQVRVLRAPAGARIDAGSADHELRFLYVLDGGLELANVEPLGPDDAVSLPTALDVDARASEPGVTVLSVTARAL